MAVGSCRFGRRSPAARITVACAVPMLDTTTAATCARRAPIRRNGYFNLAIKLNRDITLPSSRVVTFLERSCQGCRCRNSSGFKQGDFTGLRPRGSGRGAPTCCVWSPSLTYRRTTPRRCWAMLTRKFPDIDPNSSDNHFFPDSFSLYQSRSSRPSVEPVWGGDELRPP